MKYMNQNPAGKKIKCGCKPLGTRVMVSNNMTVIPTLSTSIISNIKVTQCLTLINNGNRRFKVILLKHNIIYNRKFRLDGADVRSNTIVNDHWVHSS